MFELLQERAKERQLRDEMEHELREKERQLQDIYNKQADVSAQGRIQGGFPGVCNPPWWSSFFVKMVINYRKQNKTADL